MKKILFLLALLLLHAPFVSAIPKNNDARTETLIDSRDPNTILEYQEKEGFIPNKNAYNGHSYAWCNTKGDPDDPSNKNIKDIFPLWDNDPTNNIKELNAKQLGSDEDNIVGDRVIYYDDENKNGQWDAGEHIYHSAIVYKVEDGYTVEVDSKLGFEGISKNHPRAPGFFNNWSRAYFRIPEDKLLELNS